MDFTCVKSDLYLTAIISCFFFWTVGKPSGGDIVDPLSASIIVAADISDLTFTANFAQVMGDAG